MLQLVSRRASAELIPPQFVIDDLQHLLPCEIIAIVEYLDHMEQDSAYTLSRQVLKRLQLRRFEGGRVHHHAQLRGVCGDPRFCSLQRRSRIAEGMPAGPVSTVDDRLEIVEYSSVPRENHMGQKF
jgi:hypothetical protein